MSEHSADKDAPQIDHLIELRGVYDGWSIAVMADGTVKNRWANDAGNGPEPGYERRWSATEDAIALMFARDLAAALERHRSDKATRPLPPGGGER